MNFWEFILRMIEYHSSWLVGFMVWITILILIISARTETVGRRDKQNKKETDKP